MVSLRLWAFVSVMVSLARFVPNPKVQRKPHFVERTVQMMLASMSGGNVSVSFSDKTKSMQARLEVGRQEALEKAPGADGLSRI